MWQGLAGHWDGTWTNHTFNSNGELSVDVTVNPDCTAQAVIEGVFGQPGPQTVDATYRDENGTVIEVQADPIFGDLTINLAANGALTLNGTGLHQSIESVTGIGQVSATDISIDIELTFTGGGSAEESIELLHEITATPTATATPTPSPACPGATAPPGGTCPPCPTGPGAVANSTCPPTATPTGTPGPPLTQGDVDCSGGVGSVDALKVLRHVASLPVNNPETCPDIGAEVASFWGDVDCSDLVNSVDALKILRFVAGLTVQQVGECPDIGTAVLVD
jgi:hypothetical protein